MWSWGCCWWVDIRTRERIALANKKKNHKSDTHTLAQCQTRIHIFTEREREREQQQSACRVFNSVSGWCESTHSRVREKMWNTDHINIEFVVIWEKSFSHRPVYLDIFYMNDLPWYRAFVQKNSNTTESEPIASSWCCLGGAAAVFDVSK